MVFQSVITHQVLKYHHHLFNCFSLGYSVGFLEKFGDPCGPHLMRRQCNRKLSVLLFPSFMQAEPGQGRSSQGCPWLGWEGFALEVLPTLLPQLCLDSVSQDLPEDVFSDWPACLTF